MPPRRIAFCLLTATLTLPLPAARAQTSIPGNSLALRSASSATLSSTAYVGTYLTVPAGGATLNFTLNASAGAGPAPHLNLSIADSVTGLSISSTSPTNYTTPNLTLPAGTYFVRAERDYTANAGLPTPVAVNNLAVTTLAGSPATFSNTSSNANALAAADTYIANFRQGPASLNLTGPGNVPLLPGTPVQIDLARHAFTFGTEVPGSGSDVNNWLGSSGTAQQTNYQSRLNLNFNAIVPGNAGKWQNNESTRDVNTMSNVDTILNYAQSHHMRARMHNLIWGDNSNNGQQPSWVMNNSNTGLLDKAKTGNAAAQSDLRTEISERIAYYIGNGSPSDRSKKYQELDVYNESLHTPTYTQAYGYAGIASIYNEAAAAAGPNVRLFTNEYNVLQDGPDPFANWYRTEIESIRNAGGNVGGIGIQYYANSTLGPGNSQHSPARIYAAMQNLSAQGLPLVLTEFGVKAGGEPIAPQVLSDTLRLTFGTPAATGFLMWGFYAPENLFAPAAAFYDNSLNLTPAGKAWQDLLGIQDWDGNPNNAWTTHLTARADATGQVSFTGFFGDYYLRSQSTGPYDLTLAKGTTNYSLSLAAPPTWSLWNPSNSGDWSTPNNWPSGGTPNAPGQTAHFGPSPSPRTISLSTPRTVGQLVLDSPSSYSLTGPATLTLQGFTTPDANLAAIHVLQGSHQISAPLVFLSPAALTISPGASLDITNNSLLLSTSPSTLRQYLHSRQLFSSTADSDPNRLLALAYSCSDSPQARVLLTQVGDANLDHQLNADDYTLLDRGFAKHLTTWQDGDFDYDGTIDDQDYLLIDRVFALTQVQTFNPDFLARRESQFGSTYVQSLLATLPDPALPLSSILYLLSSRLFRPRRPRFSLTP